MLEEAASAWPQPNRYDLAIEVVRDRIASLKEQLEAARETLEAIADGVRPADLPSWHSGKSWRIALAARTLSRMDSFPANRPDFYEVHVGADLWVTIDFKATAVAVVRRPAGPYGGTEELGSGVLIDRNEDGEIIGVEVLG